MGSESIVREAKDFEDSRDELEDSRDEYFSL